jgi:alkanesulfonate monooxygenase SsuD/methylene tetrahydromethanopterin reductase-like flavin-dependent oxidoreductase (luciferase family)
LRSWTCDVSFEFERHDDDSSAGIAARMARERFRRVSRTGFFVSIVSGHMPADRLAPLALIAMSGRGRMPARERAMEFGIFNLMNRRHRSQDPAAMIGQTVLQTQAAEQARFGVAWFTEHHFTNYSITPSPLMMVAHVAPQTATIRLGTAVVLPALYTPARLLGEVAFADNLSGGRLILGLGSGYQAYELARLGVTLEEAAAVADEWTELLTEGLAREAFEYHGNYLDLPRTFFTTRPVQKPRPQIWIAGNSPASQRRAAAGGHPLFVTGFGRDTAALARLRVEAEAEFARAGRDPASLRFATLRYCFVTDDRHEALAFAENARYQLRLSHYLRQGQTELDQAWLPDQAYEGEMSPEDITAWNPIGDPETVAEKLAAEIGAVGPSHIALYMSIGAADHGQVMRSIERFGGEVVPLLEQELGPLADNVPVVTG